MTSLIRSITEGLFTTLIKCNFTAYSNNLTCSLSRLLCCHIQNLKVSDLAVFHHNKIKQHTLEKKILPFPKWKTDLVHQIVPSCVEYYCKKKKEKYSLTITHIMWLHLTSGACKILRNQKYQLTSTHYYLTTYQVQETVRIFILNNNFKNHYSGMYPGSISMAVYIQLFCTYLDAGFRYTQRFLSVQHIFCLVLLGVQSST